jgi:hypothetical protein
VITDFLPKFKVVEPNNLTGLRNGHVISQLPVTSAVVYGSKSTGMYIQNGSIYGLTTIGTLGKYDDTDVIKGQMLLHFTEELNTFLDELHYFAVPFNTDGEPTYIRCVALYVGDTFTTNNYTIPDGMAINSLANSQGYDVYPMCFTVEKGTLTLQTGLNGDTTTSGSEKKTTYFLGRKSTLSDGSDAIEFLCVKAQ